jgi:hypothetical protein
MSSISQAERDRMPAEDFAGPHQSFPIRNQQDVHDAARLIGHADDPEAVKRKIIAIAKRKGFRLPDAWTERSDGGKSMGDYVIHLGAAVKAMGDGKVGGYLAQFGSEATKDADGEWFTAETDFDTEFPARASIYYNHGLDPTVGRRRLAHGTMKADDVGVWVETQLDLSDRYQAAMYQMAAAGKLGWSSGSLSHITDPPREAPGGAIKSWPLGHDASLTPIPADRRNMAIALKSWDPPPLEEMVECVPTCSLNEAIERVTDSLELLNGDMRRWSVKAGRKISNARRERLLRLRDELNDMLSETEPREAAAGEESAPPPVTGEGELPPTRLSQASPLPDPDSVYRLIRAAADHRAPLVSTP